MKHRVFIDTNVFIYGFEFPASNSAKVLELLNKGKIEAIISGQVLKEVLHYFGKHHTLELTRLFRKYLLGTCSIVEKHHVLNMMEKHKHEIKEKDLEQLATVKKLGIKYLIAYDRDFEGFDEYITPKSYIKLMEIKEAETEY